MKKNRTMTATEHRYHNFYTGFLPGDVLRLQGFYLKKDPETEVVLASVIEEHSASFLIHTGYGMAYLPKEALYRGNIGATVVGTIEEATLSAMKTAA